MVVGRGVGKVGGWGINEVFFFYFYLWVIGGGVVGVVGEWFCFGGGG